jgi:hypothetical protein
MFGAPERLPALPVEAYGYQAVFRIRIHYSTVYADPDPNPGLKIANFFQREQFFMLSSN